MINLDRAHAELFRRTPDECFGTLPELWEHCHQNRQASQTRWHNPSEVKAVPLNGHFSLQAGDQPFEMTEWSFSQLCKLANVSKETVNKLSSRTASLVFDESLPQGNKPLQIFAAGNQIRALHGASYTRLFNADVLSVAQEFATDFEAAPESSSGATGLYCGEQDMFAFLVDPTGWAEIDGQAFAPGFFLWNSEVGRRTVGVQTFWFQAVCQNHIVWDAVEVVEFTRKHTTNVEEALGEIRRIVLNISEKRDQRRDGFVKVLRNAMRERLGAVDNEVMKTLALYGINRSLAREALKLAKEHGGFTIYSVVDALTRLSQTNSFAGDRTEADLRASRLLALVA